MSVISKIAIGLVVAMYICIAQAFAHPHHHGGVHRPPMQHSYYRHSVPPVRHSYYRSPMYYRPVPPPRRYYDSFGREILRDLTDSLIWGNTYRTNYYYVNYQTPVRTIYVNGTSQSCRECGSVNCSYSGNYDCCECIEYNLGR